MSKVWKTKAAVRAASKGYGAERRQREAFEAALEVTIDWAALASELAERAANNRSGKAIILGGIIKAKIAGDVPAYKSAEGAL